MNLGDTFWAGHLYIVCSDPTADGSVVVFNATTPRWDSGRECVIQPGDHPSIKHESVIAYERGRLMTQEQQDNLEKAELFKTMRREPASRALVRRIQLGALKSDQTAQELQDITLKSLVEED